MGQDKLMFEVGVQMAQETLNKLEKDLDGKIKEFTEKSKVEINLEINNLKSIVEGLKQMKSGSDAVDEIRKRIEQLETALAEAGKKTVQAANETKKANESVASSTKRAAETEEESTTAKITHQQRYNAMLVESEKLLRRITDLRNGDDGNQLLRVGAYDISKFLDNARLIDKNDANAVANIVGEYRRLAKVYGEIAAEAEKSVKAREKVNESEKKAAEKALEAEYRARQKRVASERAQAQELVKARKESLRSQSSELEKLLSLGRGKLGTEQYEVVRNSLRAIREELRQIDTMTQRGGLSTGVLSSLGVGKDYTNTINTAKAVLNMRRQQATATQQAAAATSHLTAEEERLAQALQHTSDSAKRQSQVLSDLKSMAMQYLSVWGAQQFLSNIIEIGGQLEMQRLSIGAILQDTAHANDLFERIKSQALKSPFGVVELDAMTKQLSAYGFQYNELFDMTNRLADISAATGTGVDRLALALGHVRSEAALSGYTLRQFSMANIPLAKKLSEHLSEVEQRFVSVAEVRKRVSKKQIGYEEVLDVLKELTDEGGMFYNAQEVMSQSVKARFKNLKDAFDIMYGEMAESGVGDILKDVASLLTAVAKSWKSIIPIVEAAGISFGVYQVALLSMNATMGKNLSLVNKSILAYKAKRASELQNEALVRKLTAEELALIKTRQKLTLQDIKVALSVDSMTKADALRLVGLRKISLEDTKALIRMGTFSAAEARMALQGKILGVQLGKTGTAIRLFGASVSTALKGIAASVFGPVQLLFTGISWVMSAFEKQDAFDEARKDRMDTLNERTEEAYKNLYETSKRFSIGSSKFMTDSDINLALDDMMEKLREYSMLYNTTFNKAFEVDQYGYSVHNLAEQYEILAKGISDATEAQKAFHDMQNMVEHSFEVGDPGNGFWKNLLSVAAKVVNTGLSWIGLEILDKNEEAAIGTLTEVLTRYAETVKETNTAESLFLRNKLDIISALKEIGVSDAEGMDNKSLIRFIDNMRGNDNGDNSAYKRFYSRLSEEARKSLTDVVKAWEEEGEAYVLAAQRMKKSGQDLYETFVSQWGDNAAEWPSYWKEMVLMAVDSMTKSIAGFANMSIEKQNEIRNAFLRPFDITVDADEAKEQVNNLLVYLQNLVGKKWTVTIGVNGTDAFDDLDAAGKAYQDADKKVKQAEENLKRLGFEPGNVPLFASEPARKLAEDYNTQIATRRAARILYEAYGGDISELEKEKNKKGSGSGDDEAKRLREIAKLYKDAYEWYKKYAKQVGESSAMFKVREQFQPLFDEFNKEWNTSLSLESIPNYRENMESLLEEGMRLYQTKEHRNNYMVDAIKEFRDAISDVDYTESERRMDEFASNVKSELDAMTRAWELFNKVREETGDIDLASKLGGVEYENGKTRNLADAIRNKIEKDFEYSNVPSIPFDIRLDDKEIEKRIFDAFDENAPEREAGESEKKYSERLARYQEYIKGIVEEYKKWRDLQRDVMKTDTEVFLKNWHDEYDRQEELNRIVSQYEKERQSIESLLKNGGISSGSYNRALANLDSKFNWDIFNAKNNAKGILDKSDRASVESVKRMIKALREYAETTQMSVRETEAWYDAMSKLLDRESVLDPFDSIVDSAKVYNKAVEDRVAAEEALRIARMSKAERKREHIDESTVKSVTQAEKDLEEATQRETIAFNNCRNAVDNLVNGLNQLGNALQGIGSSVGGNMGDLLIGFANLFNSIGNSIGAIKNFQYGVKGIAGVMNKVSVVMTVVSSVIEVNRQLANILPDTDGLYEKYAEKARQVNKLREAVDNYSVAVAKARKEEGEWFAGTSLSDLRSEGDKAKTTLEAYFKELYEPQEVYKDKSSGIAKFGLAIAGGIAAIAGTIATVMTGGAAGVAILSAMTTLESLVGTVTATAIGTAIAGGIGAAVGQIAQGAVTGIFYKNGQTSARNNMRMQTRHSTWFRSEKTENLEEWVRKNLNAELFDKEGLVNLEAAQEILDKYGEKLVGDTKETLERLVKLREEYDEFIEKIENYVGDIGSSLMNNMTDAIWDWLANGENALDKFKKYASDTWRDIARDIVSTFLKVSVLDKYADTFKDLFKSWSLGVLSNDALISSVAMLSGAIASDFEGALPMAQKIAETLNNAFAAQGYDIANGSSGRSSGLSKSISGATEETNSLLASYLNAVRADVSVNREMIAEYFPMYYAAMTSGNESLRNIENHTDAIMRSNNSIMESNEQLYSLFSGLRNGTWKVPVA